MELLISLIAGALGGNVAAALLKNANLGVLLNSVAGILGGALGGKALGLMGLAGASAGTDLAAIIGQVVSGGVGGGVLLAIVGLIRNAMTR